jgi:hypothetical protein
MKPAPKTSVGGVTLVQSSRRKKTRQGEGSCSKPKGTRKLSRGQGR